MSGSRKDLPAPATADVLARRFSARDEPAPAAPAPQTDHTSHTAPAGASGRRRGGGRAEPPGKTRRTYYYSVAAADALDEAVDRLHHRSNGRISKNAALDAIIRAGVEQVDAIERRMNARGGTPADT